MATVKCKGCGASHANSKTCPVCGKPRRKIGGKHVVLLVAFVSMVAFFASFDTKPVVDPEEKVSLGWVYHEETDELTDEITKYALLESENTLELGFPYHGKQNVYLSLIARPGTGHGVLLRLKKGQFECSFRGCTVNVRFDNNEAQEFRAKQSPGSHSVLLIHDYERFVSQLMKADELRIAVNIYQDGKNILRFNPQGLKTDSFVYFATDK